MKSTSCEMYQYLETPLKIVGKTFRDFFSIFFSENLMFRMFWAALALNMHKTKYSGARDLSIDKVSALCDPWYSKKCKNENLKKSAKKNVFCSCCLISEEQCQNGCQLQIPFSFQLQMHILSALYDPWRSFYDAATYPTLDCFWFCM